MSEADEEECDWKRFTEFLVSKVQFLSAYFEQQEPVPVKIGVFGSSTEYLKCSLPHDVGDIDIMIYPVAEETTIQEDIIEYDTGSPVFVRLRGKGHDLLKHCLAEDSDYVASSSLKQFHPKLFGNASSLLTLIPNVFCKFNEFLPNDTAFNFYENPSGPALQLESIHSFGTLTDQVQHLEKDEATVMGDDMRNFAEWFAMCLNPNRNFTEEHSTCVDEYMQIAKDSLSELNQNPSVPALINTMNNLMSGEKVFELRRKVENLDTRTETRTAENQNDSNINSLSTSSAVRNDLMEVTDKSCSKDQVSACESTKDENTGTSATAQPKDKSEKEKYVEGITQTQQSTVSTDDEKQKVSENLKTCLLESAFGGSSNWSGNTNRDVEHPEQLIQVGLDIVPAFKGGGWPNVAKPWIARVRKWPNPEIITKIVENGFNLVVRTPINAERQDVHFRLSFSNAELILSGELNGIQRDCYRCLKMYYQSALKQREPKIITSYFLKTILFWTVEETGMEAWNEDNRGKCVMMLLKRLHNSLESKLLKHYFVPEFNLLEEAVNNSHQEVQELAKEVKKICDNPMEYPNVPTDEPKPEESRSKMSINPMSEKSSGAHVEKNPTYPGSTTNSNQVFMKYTDFLEVYRQVCKEMLSLALQENSSNEKDPTVEQILENFRLILSKMENPEVEMMRVLECSSQMIYSTYVLHGGSSIRQRILAALKGQSKMLAYVVHQDDLLAVGNEHLIVDRMLNSEDFDFNTLLPQAGGGELIREMSRIFPLSSSPRSNEEDDIPLD